MFFSFRSRCCFSEELFSITSPLRADCAILRCHCSFKGASFNHWLYVHFPWLFFLFLSSFSAMCSARVHKTISFLLFMLAWFVAWNVVHGEDIYASEQNVYPYLLCGMFCSYLVNPVHTLEGPLHIVLRTCLDVRMQSWNVLFSSSLKMVCLVFHVC